MKSIGQLVADALARATNADIGLVNGGSIRSSITQGSVKSKDIIEAVPFLNEVFVMENVPGKVSHTCILQRTIVNRYS